VELNHRTPVSEPALKKFAKTAQRLKMYVYRYNQRLDIRHQPPFHPDLRFVNNLTELNFECI
jgi:hypothetical protein